VCRAATADFEATLSAVGLARHFVTDRLQRWELADLIDTAALLTSELAANAVVHAGGSGPVLSMAVADGTLEIGVSDRGRPLAVRSDLAMLDERTVMAHGDRGMILLEELADDWGTVNVTGGKQVWFRLTTGDWSFRTECRCCASNLDRVRLESGRDVLARPMGRFCGTDRRLRGTTRIMPAGTLTSRSSIGVGTARRAVSEAGGVRPHR
jgi:anti-sigma regulatory factor (Ser/Thr protein kinase)